MLVLVAASDAPLRAAVARAVADAGHRVLAAADGAAAWAAFAEHRPPLLILDLGLAAGAGPGAADAWALCARVAAERPDEGGGPGFDGDGAAAPASPADAAHAPEPTPADPARDAFVIVCAPRDGAAELRRALDAGADDYLTAPPTAAAVAARLSIAERRMRQTAARRRAEEALRRARWLAGVGETSIAVQHEINNPLAALLGHAALLQEGLVAPGEEGAALQVVVEQAQRIALVMKRLAAVREARSVAYMGGARMLDLSRDAPRGPAPGGAAGAGPGGD